jgi:aminopeptidase N
MEMYMKLTSKVLVLLITCTVNVSGQNIDIYIRPVQVERSHDFDAQHYRLKLTFDLDKKEFWGENTVTIKSLSNEFKECVFDAKELIVTEVINPRNVNIKFKQTDQSVIIYFPRSFSYGENITFTIKYRANNPTKGFFFSDETARNPKMVSTDSFPNEARYWFPCYDYPHDKVTMEVIATVRKPNKVLSNGKLVGITENSEDNTVTYHWRQEKPHSTYLSMIAIAPFTVIEDSLDSLPVNYWVYKQDAENAKRVFKKTPYMIDFFNNLYGYEYPWAKYDQVVTPTQGGGAEATSATILGQNVICDEKAEKDFSWERILAHEIAHHWWGDLITLRTWSETWLNESFGTYSDYLYIRHARGEDEGAYELLNKKNTYLNEAHSKYIRPIVFNRYEEPGHNFDRHTYQKGACVIHMLRFVMGDESFFRTLKYFLHKHEYQAVDTQDFMKAVKEATGQNLDWFFEQFIYKPGHPVFDVRYEWIESKQTVRLFVSQEQDLSLGIPVYKIPVNIGIVTPNNKITKKVWIEQREEIFEFSVTGKPLMVRFDEGHNLLKEWTFEKSADELLYQLQNDDVIGRMWAASELVKFDYSPKVLAELTNIALNDSSWAVRKSAIEALGSSTVMVASDLLMKICGDNNSRVRTAALRILGETENPNFIPFLQKQFSRDDSYAAQAEALRSIGKCGDQSHIAFLKNAAAMNSYRDMIQKAAELALNEIQNK